MGEREPIAIVGIGCRFPGASSPAGFWDLLRDGRSAVREVPADRWNAASLFDPDPAARGKINCRRGGFLDDVYGFDREFFRIGQDEAEAMDPQQRMLLEVAWEALEDAGWPAHKWRGQPGAVFAGIGPGDYGRLHLREPLGIGPHTNMGNQLSIAANRLSYFFDLRGPSVALDTACSSSLVAVHLACQSLWTGDASFALAGGVNALLEPPLSIGFSKAGMLSTRGECYCFDRRADGYVRGEGAGVVVLKLERRAVEDGDTIRGLILGSAIGQSGRTNGLGAPRPHRQEQVVREALRRSGVPGHRVQYVEAHSIGTPLGDVIEAEALGAVLNDGHREAPCALGSVKSNIGHLETAAGVASLIKTTLALEHGVIPPTLNCEEPNPYIRFEELGLRVQREASSWTTKGSGAGEPVAGVSSFGFGGMNAHVVVTGAPATEETSAVRSSPADGLSRVTVLPLSARSAGALRTLANGYRKLLAADPFDRAALTDLCFSAAVHRSHHPHRLALLGESSSDLVAALDAWMAGREHPQVVVGQSGRNRPAVVFLFGAGSRESAAVASARSFLRARRDSAEVLEALEGLEASEEEVDGPAARSWSSAVVDQVAWAVLWKSWGVVPDAVLAWREGEIAASLAAGLLEPEEVTALLRTVSRPRPDSSTTRGKAPARRPLLPYFALQFPSVEPPDQWRRPSSLPPRVSVAQAVERLGEGASVLLEIGLGATWNAELEEALAARGPVVRIEASEGDPRPSITRALATLYVHGHDLDWNGLRLAGRFVRLPSYPWQR